MDADTIRPNAGHDWPTEAPPVAAAQATPVRVPAPRPPPEPDPLWDAFEAATPSERPALVRRMIETPSEFGADWDPDLAFEIFSHMDGEARTTEAGDELEELLDLLRERQPEAYSENEAYIVGWRLERAVRARRPDAVRQLGPQYASCAGEVPDLFPNAVSMLAFHGYTDVLAQMGPDASTALDGSDVFEEFQERGAREALHYEILCRLERAPAEARWDDALRELGSKLEIEDDSYAREAMERLTGRAQRAWRPEDLDFPRVEQVNDGRRKVRSEKKDDLRRRRNLRALREEWTGWLVRQAGFPAVRADLAAREMEYCVLRRAQGDMAERPSLQEKAVRLPRPEHALCPDGWTFRNLDLLAVGMFEEGSHSNAALIAATPGWLKFLGEKGLACEEACARSLESIRAPVEAWLAALRDPDPFIPCCIAESWERFGANLPEFANPSP
jgi:hypothetical protein